MVDLTARPQCVFGMGWAALVYSCLSGWIISAAVLRKQLCTAYAASPPGSSLLSCFFVVARGGGLPPAGHTQRNQANPTAGGPRQSLTSEIRLIPILQQLFALSRSH
jgi:hypothetical protein